MDYNNKTTFRKFPLLEISLHTTHMHIVDFENEKNNEVFYYNKLQTIEILNEQIVIGYFNKSITVNIEKHKISEAENIVNQIKELKLSKEILWPKKLYKLETFEDLENRYNGFGKKLYYNLKTENPKVFNNLRFYQELNDEKDSYAEYIDDNTSFVIQLDFYSELILVWNNENTIEIGSWENDEVKKAINIILNKFLTKK